MYSTCIYCHRPLGANGVLEEFPVGRRLAFDAARGRLWVVCSRCERWNLSPIEERWEAIEAAERLFRDIRTRVSTENIGLARHPEGLELVRIGKPLRPEFAAWRYGDQFGRRRRRAILVGGGVVGALGAAAVAGLATGVISATLVAQSGNFYGLWMQLRTQVKLRTDEGELLRLRIADLHRTRLGRTPEGEWSLTFRDPRASVFGLSSMEFTGEAAERMVGKIMPRLNARGAGDRTIREAVREIERVGGPEAYLAGVVERSVRGTRASAYRERDALLLGRLPTPTRLALEMALHEEQERRALEGELHALELAWKEAEEIAAIADDLLVPEPVRERLERARESGSDPSALRPADKHFEDGAASRVDANPA